MLRLRTVAYPALLMAVGIAFVTVLSTKREFDAKLIRERGTPFHRTVGGAISNEFNLRLVNRTADRRQYQVVMTQPPDATVKYIEQDEVELSSGGTSLVPIRVEIPLSRFDPSGRCASKFKISDDVGNERIIEIELLGPG